MRWTCLGIILETSACFRTGGGARVVIDPKDGETGLDVYGNFGGVVFKDMDAEEYHRSAIVLAAPISAQFSTSGGLAPTLAAGIEANRLWWNPGGSYY